LAPHGGGYAQDERKATTHMNATLAVLLADGIYIGGGVLLLILIILLVLFLLRRA